MPRRPRRNHSPAFKAKFAAGASYAVWRLQLGIRQWTLRALEARIPHLWKAFVFDKVPGLRDAKDAR